MSKIRAQLPVVLQLFTTPASSMEAKTYTFKYSFQAESSSSTVCSLSGVYKRKGKSLHKVYLCVVPVNVTFEDKSVITYAFLDQRSTQCFCGKTLVDGHD